MTRLFNDPNDFTDQMIDGFVAANRRWVRRVSGGVVRSTKSIPGTVAIVTGGGTGHYPAFGGLVGPGLAHGAALGNVFASPSSQQVQSVALAAENGGGILLSYGNYAGDVLHFGNAQKKLRDKGFDVETVTVTDDIASAPRTEKHKRRGIAGDLTVFKAAAAAAEAGYPLAEVVRVARHANERTRSFGVAFSGCTLPGATEPLFTVPEGRMGVGMGIHGEPGIGEDAIPTADDLATLLVDRLLAELPDETETVDGARVAVILNGLGDVKYEELFVLYSSIDHRLRSEGAVIVEPEVGELVTSFDMAGVSLTLFWLDEELEEFWNAPVDTPAYKKGAVAHIGQDDSIAEDDAPDDLVPPATIESQDAARLVFTTLEAVKKTIDDTAEELGRIDAVAGDGDHGIGMQRGANAAVAAAWETLQTGAGTQTLLTRAADAWSDRAGGTSGALWGAALEALGQALTDFERPRSASVAKGIDAARDAILEFGAVPGDKTMVDALVPFADTLLDQVNQGTRLPEAWQAAAASSTVAAANTAHLLPKMGRARPHAEKSLGTPDAGAHSFALIVTAVGKTLAQARTSTS